MKEPLNLRQRLAIHMAIFIIGILQPMAYTHEWEAWRKDFLSKMSGE